MSPESQGWGGGGSKPLFTNFPALEPVFVACIPVTWKVERPVNSELPENLHLRPLLFDYFCTCFNPILNSGTKKIHFQICLLLEHLWQRNLPVTSLNSLRHVTRHRPINARPAAPEIAPFSNKNKWLFCLCIFRVLPCFSCFDCVKIAAKRQWHCGACICVIDRDLQASRRFKSSRIRDLCCQVATMGSTDILFSKRLPLLLKSPDRDKRWDTDFQISDKGLR